MWRTCVGLAPALRSIAWAWPRPHFAWRTVGRCFYIRSSSETELRRAMPRSASRHQRQVAAPPVSAASYCRTKHQPPRQIIRDNPSYLLSRKFSWRLERSPFPRNAHAGNPRIAKRVGGLCWLMSSFRFSLRGRAPTSLYANSRKGRHVIQDGRRRRHRR